MDTVEKGHTLTVPGWLDLKVSLGNLLTIGTILVAGIVSYSRMDGRVTENEKALTKAEIVYIRKDVADLRQEALTVRLEDLKSQLDRVEKKLDTIRP